MQAAVRNIFENTNSTQESVDQLLNEAINNAEGLLGNASFTSKDLLHIKLMDFNTYNVIQL